MDFSKFRKMVKSASLLPRIPTTGLYLIICFVGIVVWLALHDRDSFIRPKGSIRNATICWDNITLVMSTTGAASTLPSFFFMAGAEEGGNLYSGFNYTGGRGEPQPFNPKTSCPDDVFENTMDDQRVSQLPWRLQDDWGCERKLQNVSVLVIENEYLKATIAPQWGGKIWSLYHKKLKRHLLYNNPAHQPANIGYRKAWTSGGCEWNWGPGQIGHSVFTESPVWTAVLNTKWGPVVRVYEYDRQNSTVWQVDMLLRGETLLAHPKITNPNDHEVPGYWWTCVAMSVDGPKNRVLSPASMSIVNNGQCVPWPWGPFNLENSSFRGVDIDDCAQDQTCGWQTDLSLVGNIPIAKDFFFRIPKNVTNHWIAQVQEDGLTVIHSHPSFLNGTKFFQWGFHEKGFFNQDFLSATDTNNDCNPDAYDPYCMDSHPGLYTELQIGPARTQMHTFPLEASSSIEWTEWFKAWMADTDQMQHRDYQVALTAVQTWWAGENGMTDEFLKEADLLLKGLADVAPEKKQIVSVGMPWGGLYEMVQRQRHGHDLFSLAPGCLFPPPDSTEETKPWLELLQTGTFSEETLSAIPVNFEVSDHWIQMLQESVDTGKGTWLHLLFLGTHALEVGNMEEARQKFNGSLKLKQSVHALRNLAIIAETENQVIALYLRAFKTWQELPDIQNVLKLGADLSGEIIGWLIGNKRWSELELFLQTLRSSSRSVRFLEKDRAKHAQAALDVRSGNHKSALAILRHNCFPTYGSLRRDLLALWWLANKQNATAAKDGGIPLAKTELLALRRQLRCDGDQGDRGVDDPCVCGPPNLGYSYG